MKAIIHLSLAALFFAACGCTKDNLEQLPPITQTGANTFGCLYNGKVFTPQSPDPQFMQPTPGSPISYIGYFDTDNYSNMIYAVRSKDITNIQYIHVYIYKLDANGVGVYKLNEPVYSIHADQPFHCYISCRAISPTTGKYKFYGSYTNSGTIVITRYDKENYITSGTFEATLREDGGSEAINITDGRFDINRRTLK